MPPDQTLRRKVLWIVTTLAALCVAFGYTLESRLKYDGGAAAEIAAVDLYARGSTSVFYDDLALEPLPK